MQEEMELKEIIDQAEALKTGKRCKGLMSGVGSLSQISDYKKKDNLVIQQQNHKCNTCGRNKSSHNNQPCFALKLVCRKCNQTGHISLGKACSQWSTKGKVSNLDGVRESETKVETSDDKGDSAALTGQLSLTPAFGSEYGNFFFTEVSGGNKLDHHTFMNGTWKPGMVKPLQC